MTFIEVLRCVVIIIVLIAVIVVILVVIIKVIIVIQFPLESFGQLWPVGLKGGRRFHMNPWRSSEQHSDKVHQHVLCLPVGHLTELWLDIITERGMGDG